MDVKAPRNRCGGVLRKLRLQSTVCGVEVDEFFARLHPWVRPNARHQRSSGNPVRFGDGSATVSGYRLPSRKTATALVRRCGKAGARFETRSPDIAPRVLVRICLGAARKGWFPADITSPAKRRMRPGPARVAFGHARFCCLHSHTAGDEGFFVGSTGVNRGGPQWAVISGLVS